MLNELERRPAAAPEGVFVILLLVQLAFFASGMFYWGGLVFLVAANALAIAMHLGLVRFRFALEPVMIAFLVAFVAIGAAGMPTSFEPMVYYRLPGITGSCKGPSPYGIAMHLAKFAAVFPTLLLTIPDGKKRMGVFLSLFAVVIAVKVMCVAAIPYPSIDVYDLQQLGARVLVQTGRNIYSYPFQPPIFEGDAAPYYGYCYPPVVFYPTVIAWILFKDIRIAWVACDALGAMLLYLTARRLNPDPSRRRFCQLIALLFLFLPHSAHITQSAWTEPLTLMAMGGLAYALASGRGAWHTGAMLGVWLTSKQYVPLVVPFLLKLRRVSPRAWLAAAATGITLALPFMLWDFRGMWNHVVVFFIKAPQREDAVSVTAAAAQFGIHVPFWATAAALACAMAFFFWRMRPTLSSWLFSSASLWMFCFTVGKQSFQNYFHLISYVLLLAIACAVGEASSEEAPQAGT